MQEWYRVVGMSRCFHLKEVLTSIPGTELKTSSWMTNRLLLSPGHVKQCSRPFEMSLTKQWTCCSTPPERTAELKSLECLAAGIELLREIASHAAAPSRTPHRRKQASHRRARRLIGYARVIEQAAPFAQSVAPWVTARREHKRGPQLLTVSDI